SLLRGSASRMPRAVGRRWNKSRLLRSSERSGTAPRAAIGTDDHSTAGVGSILAQINGVERPGGVGMRPRPGRTAATPANSPDVVIVRNLEFQMTIPYDYQHQRGGFRSTSRGDSMQTSFASIALGLALAVPGYAQTTGAATIIGTVSDTTGAVIPSAK